MLVVESHKKKETTILKQYPNAVIADVTSHASSELIKLSPFYPHGDIPVPYSNGITAMCVEAIWQGLKVFENADIDTSLFSNTSMSNIKRTVRKFGKPLGHRKGVYGELLLGYIEARHLIYLPSYKWVLENKVNHLIEYLRKISQDRTVVLLDYATNSDIDNPSKPLSHAFLIKAYIEGIYPFGDKNVSYSTQLSLF